MRIQFLGTAAAEGWPGVFCTCENCVSARTLRGKNLRSRQQLLMDDNLLVDLGPDTMAHSLMHGLDLGKVTTCLVTHPHQDHFYPEELCMHRHPFAYGAAHLTVYGSDKTVAECDRFIMQEHNLGKLGVSTQEVYPFQTFTADDAHVTPLLALHNRSFLCMFYLIKKGGKVVLQGYDTGWYPEETWEALAAYQAAGGRLDAVIMDCTTGPLPEGTNHCGLPDNAKIRAKLIEMGIDKPGTRWIVTHFSHNGRMLHDDLVWEAGVLGFEVAYDGWCVEL